MALFMLSHPCFCLLQFSLGNKCIHGAGNKLSLGKARTDSSSRNIVIYLFINLIILINAKDTTRWKHTWFLFSRHLRLKGEIKICTESRQQLHYWMRNQSIVSGIHVWRWQRSLALSWEGSCSLWDWNSLTSGMCGRLVAGKRAFRGEWMAEVKARGTKVFGVFWEWSTFIGPPVSHEWWVELSLEKFRPDLKVTRFT